MVEKNFGQRPMFLVPSPRLGSQFHLTQKINFWKRKGAHMGKHFGTSLLLCQGNTLSGKVLQFSAGVTAPVTRNFTRKKH